MNKKSKALVFSFEEVVVIRFCLKVFQQTDFSNLAPDGEIRQAKIMAGEIHDQLTKVEHSLTFSQLCVIGGAVDNFEDLINQGQNFDLPEQTIQGYALLLPRIQQKVKKMVAN